MLLNVSQTRHVRSLYSYPRGLVAYWYARRKEPLHLPQKSLIYPQKSPMSPAKEPYIPTEEPYISAIAFLSATLWRYDNLSAKKPCICRKRGLYTHQKAQCLLKRASYFPLSYSVTMRKSLVKGAPPKVSCDNPLCSFVLTRAFGPRKRAPPNISRENPFPINESRSAYLHVKGTLPCLHLKEPYRHSIEPFLLSKQAHLHSKPACFHSEEYYLHSKEPDLHSKEPYLHSKESHLH